MTCRKETGAPFKHFAVFRKQDVAIAGETSGWAAPGGHPRHFCPSCGSRLFAYSDDAEEIELDAGALDMPDCLAPSYEAYVSRRESWLPDLGLQQYPGNRPSPE